MLARAALEMRVTEAVRDADQLWVETGKTRRAWVRDFFLPALEARGLRVLPGPSESG